MSSKLKSTQLNDETIGNESVETPIMNEQQLWDAIIQHYNDGDSDKLAMQEVNTRMKQFSGAPGVDQDQYLANVISAIYANTYWTDINMNSELLANNMTQATQRKLEEARVFAKTAFTQWRGVLARKTTNDVGTIPYPTDDFTNGVDIVCSVVPASTNSLIDDWNSQFWKTPLIGKNYIYVRCQNFKFGGAITKPQAWLFYTQAGFNAPPSAWIQLYTDASTSLVGDILLHGGKTGSLTPVNSRGVSEAFIFNKLSHDHITFVAAISSEFFANNPLIYSGNWNSVTWIRNNGAAVWQSTDPQISEKPLLKFYNQDSKPEKFAFEAHCKNVPEGTVVALNFKDSKLQNFNSDNVTISSKSQNVETETVVPANYKGDLEVVINTPDGKLLPEGASVEVKMSWLLDPDHDRYLDAANLLDANEDARASGNMKVPMGSFTFLGTSK
jgi:hypothetical protein